MILGYFRFWGVLRFRILGFGVSGFQVLFVGFGGILKS